MRVRELLALDRRAKRLYRRMVKRHPGVGTESNPWGTHYDHGFADGYGRENRVYGLEELLMKGWVVE